MKKRALFTLFTLILMSCGKTDGPNQDYIVTDEFSSISTARIEGDLQDQQDQQDLQDLQDQQDQQAITPELEEITFDDDSCESNNIQKDITLFSDKIQSLGGTINEV